MTAKVDRMGNVVAFFVSIDGQLWGPMDYERAAQLFDSGEAKGIFPVGPSQMYDKAEWRGREEGWYLHLNPEILEGVDYE